MPKWQHFLEVRLGTYVESWVEQNVGPNSQYKSRDFLQKNTKDPTKSYIDGHLWLKSRDFASMFGLVDISWSWDLGPHVN